MAPLTTSEQLEAAAKVSLAWTQAQLFSLYSGVSVEAVRLEAVASQLPGRTDGLADSYRHVLWAAEVTRVNGDIFSQATLGLHETFSTGNIQAAGHAVDYWNNDIGITIGQYVRNQGGTWEDVKLMVRQAMSATFANTSLNDAENWVSHPAADSTEFKTPGSGTITIASGLTINQIAVLDPSKWEVNPLGPNGEISNAEANWPSSAWTSDFNYQGAETALNYPGQAIRPIYQGANGEYFKLDFTSPSQITIRTNTSTSSIANILASMNQEGLEKIGTSRMVLKDLNGDGVYSDVTWVPLDNTRPLYSDIQATLKSAGLGFQTTPTGQSISNSAGTFGHILPSNTVLNSASGQSMILGDAIDMINNQIIKAASFLDRQAGYLVEYYRNEQNQALLQDATARIITRLINGENFNTVITQEVTVLLAQPYVLDYLTKDLGLPTEGLAGKATEVLTQVILQTIIQGPDQFGAVLQNASVQAAINYSLSNSGISFLQGPNNSLSTQGAGVAAALMVFISAGLSGNGVTQQTVGQAAIAYSTTVTATALVSALSGGATTGYTFFSAAGGFPPIGFDPMTMVAAAILTQIAIKLLTGSKVYHNETIGSSIETQADGSLKVIGLREAGAILRTTGTTNDDYYGTDSADDSSGADVIVAQGGKNEIYARGGHDFIEGRGNADYIEAGTGNDQVEAGEGDDFVDGGAGSDRIFGQAGNDKLIGNTGDDLILGGAGDDQIEGNDGDDQLFGGLASDTIIGGAGNDVIDGGSGNDTLSGEAGDDQITGGSGDDQLMGDDGNDTISGGVGNDDLKGGNGNDILFGEEGIDILNGGDGNDALDGGVENDLIFGGVGNDTLVGGFGDDELYGEFGTDLLAGGAGSDLLNGGEGDDLYIFSQGDGQDTIEDTAGTNQILLKGFESLYQTLLKRVGDDLIITFAGNDTDKLTLKNHFISPVIDSIYDGASQSIQLSFATFDTNGDGSYFAWFGSNLPNGYESQKSLYQQLVAPFNVSTTFSTSWLTNNFDTSVINDSYQLELYNDIQVRMWKKKAGFMGMKTSIGYYDYYETQLKGSGYSDRIVGLFGAETINGDTANDQLYGNGGNDIILGGIDHDIIFGGEGDDNISGEAGNDKTFGGFGIDTITGGTGNDTLYGEQGNDTLSGNENDDYLSGGDGNDTLNGDAGSDIIYGDAGNDTINGGTEADYINGGAGNDILNGDTGNDILFGEDGDDTLNGGDGDDIILGGKGTNTINGGSGSDILVLSGDAKDYNIVFNSVGIVTQVTDLRPDASDGINNLTSIEKLQFGEKIVTISDILKPAIGNLIVAQGSEYYNYTGIPEGYSVQITLEPTLGHIKTVGGPNNTQGISYDAPDNFIGTTTFKYRLTTPEGISREFTSSITVVGATVAGTQPTLATTQIEVADYIFQNAGLGIEEQISSRMTKLSSGDYVLTWSSYGEDGSDYGVYGRIYSRSGDAITSKFLVNTNTTGKQYFADPVALPTDDAYYVAYTDVNATGSGDVILAYFYGDYPMLEMTVNETTVSTQTAPKAELLKNGSIAVVWQSNQTGTGTNGTDIYARIFDTSGVADPIGGEFKVNQTAVNGNQINPQVVGLSNGEFIVVWEDQGANDGSGKGIYGQRVSATGTLQGTTSLLNTTTTGDQAESSVAALRDGGFVVTWTAAGQDGAGTAIYAQRYSTTFAKAGTEFRVNTTTAGDQLASDVIGLIDGGFFVVWQSPDASGMGIYGQRYNASGTALGSEFKINNETTGNQYYPSIIQLENGDLTVTWQSFNDPLHPKVMSRRLIVGTTGLTMTGTTGDDVILGGENTDTINGGNGNDIILGGFANSTPGNIIDGGAGIDTAVFGQYSESYNITINGNFDGKVQVTEKYPNSIGGVEASILTNIEKLQFDDQTIDLASYLPSLPNITLAANGSYQAQLLLPSGFSLMSVQAPTSGSVSFSGNTYTINAGTAPGSYTYRYSITNLDGVTKYLESNFVVPQPPANVYTAQTDVQVGTFVAGSDDALTSVKLAKRTNGFVTIWVSSGNDGSGDSILGQLLDSSNNLVGSTFTVNTTTTNSQNMSDVIGLANGGFVVVWASYALGNYDVIMQRYNAAGTKVGSEINLNSTLMESQVTPAIAEMSNGDLVATWLSQTGTLYNVMTRRFSSAGVAITSETAISYFNNGNPQDGKDPSITVLSSGAYVISWTDGANLFANIYNSSNVQIGTTLTLNEAATATRKDLSIAALTGGGFIVTWSSLNQDAVNTYGVYGQIFDATGVKVGSNFLVNTNTNYDQEYGAVTSLQSGGFVVVWQSYNSSISNDSEYAQVFDAIGNKVGSEIMISPSTNVFDPRLPDVMELPNGDLIFAYKRTDSGTKVVTRRYTRSAGIWTYTGNASDNVVVGSAAADNIQGADGEDTLIGSGGNDIINGGNFADTAVFSGSLANYTVTIGDSTISVKDNRTGTPDGTDTLTSIESLKFSDTTISSGIITGLGRLRTSLGKTHTYEIPAGLTVQIVSQPSVGSVALVNGKLVYTAPSGAVGTATFGYKLTNAQGIIRQGNATVQVFPASASALGYTPGTEYLISNITGSVGNNEISEMVRLNNGNYVVTYASGNDDNSRIYGARFTSAGVIIGTPFVVSPVGFLQDQYSSAVVALNDGGFVIVYSGFNGGGNYNRSEAYMQRYNSSGAAVGTLVQINPDTAGDQSYVNATVMSDGKLVVAYHTVNASEWGIRWYESWNSRIVIRTYDTAGLAIGTETIISNSGTEHPRLPSVASIAPDRYVVIWQTGGQPPDSAYSIRGQIMTAAGVKVGAEFTLESQTLTNNVYNYVTEVAKLQNGGFVVTWHGNDNNNMGIFARWYDQNGTAVSGRVTVNAYYNSTQFYPQVIAMNDGGAYVTWTSYGEDGSGWTVKGQRYDLNGNSVGSNVTINSTTTGDQYGLTVVEMLNGDLVFQWEDRSNPSVPKIVQRRFTALGESGYSLTGDTSNDILSGGNSSDVLMGNAGSDTLIGRGGNDTLSGGAGDDTYLIDLANGADIIDNQDSAGNDKVIFGTGIDRHDLWFSQKGYDLKIEQLGTLDSVTVQGWYLNDNQRVDQIGLADGSKLDKSKIDQLVSAMAGFNPQGIGSVTALNELPQSVQNTISASWQA